MRQIGFHSISMIVLLLMVVLIGCKKDEDDENNQPAVINNHFKIEETEYDVSIAWIENRGQDTYYDGYNYEFLLGTNGIGYQQDTSGTVEISGSGQVLYFSLYSSLNNGLSSGEYTYTSNSHYPIGSYDDAGYSENWDENNGGNNQWWDIESGKVTVSKTNNVYTIVIDCVDYNGKKVTGYYNGELEYTVEN